MRRLRSSGDAAPAVSPPALGTRLLVFSILLNLLILQGCAVVQRLPGIGGIASGRPAVGTASFYGKRHRGMRTASGERYDPYAFTAAHPSLPFGTRVKVTNLENGRSVVVRVNDRGPFVASRVIDLSLAAARAIGMANDGTARVRVKPLR